MARIRGSVRLGAVIDKRGSVQSLKLISGHPFLVEAAIQTAKGYRFRPATIQGVPAQSVQVVAVTFKDSADVAVAVRRPAVTWKEDEIWLKQDGSPPMQLTHDGCEKGREPAWSPNSETVAYFTDTTVNHPHCPTEVVLLSADGMRIKAIPALDRGNAVMRIDWLGNDRIGIDTHINPSLGEYRVMDVASGRQLVSYLGCGFRPSPDFRHIAHSGWIPHFSPPFAKNNYLVVDRAVIYPPDAGNTPNIRSPDADLLLFRHIHSFRSEFAWSPDGRQIAFVEKLFDWRADQFASDYGTEENHRWQLVVVPSAGGTPIRKELPEVFEGVVNVSWPTPDRVKIEGGGIDSEWPIARVIAPKSKSNESRYRVRMP